MIVRRDRAVVERSEPALCDAQTLDERVTRLVELRSAEGYTAEASHHDNGTCIIIENHCPICAAAACQGFCRSELALCARLLPPARVERSEQRLAGSPTLLLSALIWSRRC